MAAAIIRTSSSSSSRIGTNASACKHLRTPHPHTHITHSQTLFREMNTSLRQLPMPGARTHTGCTILGVRRSAPGDGARLADEHRQARGSVYTTLWRTTQQRVLHWSANYATQHYTTLHNTTQQNITLHYIILRRTAPRHLRQAGMAARQTRPSSYAKRDQSF